VARSDRQASSRRGRREPGSRYARAGMQRGSLSVAYGRQNEDSATCRSRLEILRESGAIETRRLRSSRVLPGRPGAPKGEDGTRASRWRELYGTQRSGTKPSTTRSRSTMRELHAQVKCGGKTNPWHGRSIGRPSVPRTRRRSDDPPTRKTRGRAERALVDMEHRAGETDPGLQMWFARGLQIASERTRGKKRGSCASGGRRRPGEAMVNYPRAGRDGRSQARRKEKAIQDTRARGGSDRPVSSRMQASSGAVPVLECVSE